MAKKGERTGVYVNCEYCGKLVYKTQTNFKKHKHHYCSNECQRKKEAEYKRVDKVCPICGKIFNVRRSVPQIYCSKECLNEHNRRMNKKNPRPSKKIHCQCDYCGEDIFIKPSRYKRYKHHFCSMKCNRKWFTEVYSTTEEWKDESRKRAVQILSNNIPTTQTKPQIEMNNLLEQMGVLYENERGFTYYSVDNYLTDYGLIIEVMGDYWHSSPLKYTQESINKMQTKVIGRDKAKHSYILKYYEIPILYLWENDIEKNKELCVELVKAYIKNDGNLSAYNSFNYEIIDNKLVLREELMPTFAGII